MIDRQLLRTNADAVRAGARRKGIDAPIDEFLSADKAWRQAISKFEDQKAKANGVSKTIGSLKAQGKHEEADAAMKEAARIKEELPNLEEAAKNLEAELQKLELQIPNIPHESVPDGKSSEDNVEVRSWGSQPKFAFEPKPHWELASALDIIDFERGTKVAGSGFLVYKGLGARLQRALINFMLDFHTDNHGYTEIYPPYLVNRESLIGTGQLPKFEFDQYRIERDDLFLIPTAEVPVTNLHRDEILDSGNMPVYYCAFSGCFRREAGAAGRDTRGLLRIHEFDKVELVITTYPEQSYEELERLARDGGAILEALGLHYKVMSICAGDMGFSNAKQYDLEVWSPGVGQYLEVSSASNFEDFQARRANIRYRFPGEKPQFAHTLNASGVACPRLMAALLETYQREDGSIGLPEALWPYMNVEEIR